MNPDECGGSNGIDSSPESCKCSSDRSKTSGDQQCCSPQTSKSKKPNSLSSLAQNLRRGRSLNFTNKRARKCGRQSKEIVTSPSSGPKKSPKWVMKFNCTKKDRKCTEDARNPKCCVCTCYRRTEEHHLGAGVVFQNDSPPAELAESSGEEATTSSKQTKEVSEEADEENYRPTGNDAYGNSLVQLPWGTRAVEVFVDDCEEQARMQRAREIEQGVEPPVNFRPFRRLQLLYPQEVAYEDGGSLPRRLQLVCPADLSVDSLRALFQTHVTLRSCPLNSVTGCHTQVDYVHCLVPDLLAITGCSSYWGKMDRYEAERLLDGKPEGTFLLRDSAQEEFLFSVSFRKYGRSLHARIEQWNHKFSFDSHDPSVYASETVCGLIEHYKDPSSCMFFEPMLTLPLHRNFTFSLQHLCRAVIASRLDYDSVNQLQLPKSLKSYLKEYHYRQKVRVERFDENMCWIDFRHLDCDG